MSFQNFIKIIWRYSSLIKAEYMAAGLPVALDMDQKRA